MFNKYFTAFNIELQKKLKTSNKSGKAVKGKMDVKDQKYIDVIGDMLAGLIPTGLKIDIHRRERIL
jgi:hypothetical protein